MRKRPTTGYPAELYCWAMLMANKHSLPSRYHHRFASEFVSEALQPGGGTIRAKNNFGRVVRLARRANGDLKVTVRKS